MNSKEVIENTIKNAIQGVTGIANIENDASLVDRSMTIAPSCFIYIFDILEKKLRLPVYDIFTNHTVEVMTVENLINALFELEPLG